jgi:hypothetical protein
MGETRLPPKGSTTRLNAAVLDYTWPFAENSRVVGGDRPFCSRLAGAQLAEGSSSLVVSNHIVARSDCRPVVIGWSDLTGSELVRLPAAPEVNGPDQRHETPGPVISCRSLRAIACVNEL